MTTVNKNLAMVLIAVVVVSTGGVFAFTENTQPQQTPSSLKGQPAILGHLELVAKDSQGNIVAYRQTDNTVMSDGKNATINVLFGAGLQSLCSGCTAPSIFKFVGVGTNSTAGSYINTHLLQQGNKVCACTGATLTAITASGGTGMGAQIVGNWAANHLINGSGTTAIVEAGLFDGFANNTSNMYARQTFAAINVAAADTLQVTWKITFS